MQTAANQAKLLNDALQLIEAAKIDLLHGNVANADDKLRKFLWARKGEIDAFRRGDEVEDLEQEIQRENDAALQAELAHGNALSNVGPATKAS